MQMQLTYDTHMLQTSNSDVYILISAPCVTQHFAVDTSTKPGIR